MSLSVADHKLSRGLKSYDADVAAPDLNSKEGGRRFASVKGVRTVAEVGSKRRVRMRVRACLRKLLFAAASRDPDHRDLQALSLRYSQLQPFPPDF
jgi:hypothetical protein